jgi:hypothetical protein
MQAENNFAEKKRIDLEGLHKKKQAAGIRN